MELDGRYNSTHTRVYIYIYIYISGGGWTHFGLTLRAETLPLGKLSSENAHPRYGKCKHFCGSSAQWAERRFWVDSRQLLDGSIVLSRNAPHIGTLNRSNRSFCTRHRRVALMALRWRVGGWVESRGGGAAEGKNEFLREASETGWWRRGPPRPPTRPFILFTRKYTDPDRCVCPTKSWENVLGAKWNRYIHGNEIIDSRRFSHLSFHATLSRFTDHRE